MLLAVETEPAPGAETLTVSFDPKALDAIFEQPSAGSAYIFLSYKNEYRKTGTLNRYTLEGSGKQVVEAAFGPMNVLSLRRTGGVLTIDLTVDNFQYEQIGVDAKSGRAVLPRFYFGPD